MKTLLKIIGGIVAVIYFAIVIFLTVCLLNYNDYNVTVLGDKTLVIVEDDSLEPAYNKGDLIVVKRTKNDDMKVGNDIFFYRTTFEKVEINLAKVTVADKITDTETSFTVEGNYKTSSAYVIGDNKDAKEYNGLGSILKMLESRWGFLLFVILPVFVIFIYEIYITVIAVKDEVKKDKKKTSKSEE